MTDMIDILRTALDLDVRDRAALAERLLASLEDLSDDEAEALWTAEAARRRDEYRAGQAGSIPAQDVHEKAERLLG